MANKAVWEQRSLPAELCEWCGICNCTLDDLGAQGLLKVMAQTKEFNPPSQMQDSFSKWIGDESSWNYRCQKESFCSAC